MEQQNSTAEGASDLARDPSVWRNEVQARVAGYRTRRGRRIEGAFSMRFPFPPIDALAALPEESPSSGIAEFDSATETASNEAEGESARSFSPDRAAGAETTAPAPETNDAPADEPFEFTPAPPPRPKRKVIAFPRPANAEPIVPVEEPLVPEQPRILDVQEELPLVPATPLLDGLLLPSHQRHEEMQADHVELPLQPASIAQRLYAGLVDCLLVGAAAGVFVAAGYKWMPKVELTKPMLMILAAIPVLLWAAYQYLFLKYGGRTAGMRVAGIRLSSFKGAAPRWRQRRKRVIGLYFSTASLMMGLLWALVDVDMLCWHDRLSGTYLIRE